MTSKCFGHAKINGRQTTSYASSRGEHTLHTSSAASRGHNKHCHHTGRTFCVLWRAHRSPGTLKRRGWTLAFARFESSKRACTTCGNRCGHCAASEPASCQFVGAQRTSSTTWDESTPCTSTQRSRKGDAQRWAGPAIASKARTQAPPTRHCYVSMMLSVPHPAPLRANSTVPHKPRLPHSSWAQGCGVGVLEQTTACWCQLRSCPARSRDGAASVADMTAVTSAVAPGHHPAWSPVLREDRPLAVGSTRAL